MLPKSIRWRVQLWHGALLLATVATLIIGFYSYQRQSQLQAVDNELHQFLTPLLPRLAPLGPPRPGRGGHDPGERGNHGPPHSPRPDEAASISETSPDFYYARRSPDGDVARSGNAPAVVPFPQSNEPGARNMFRARGQFRELIHEVPNGYVVIVGTSLDRVDQELRHLAFWLVVSGMGVVILGVAGGWWLTGRTLRPIEQINATAKKIAAGDLSQRIPLDEKESELGLLAANLNRTFERLERSFDQQVQFTADASHELRTPLTVMLTQIQLALSRERTAESYRETLQTCERAAERMRVLVNSLLELARVDSGEFQVNREKCDLGRVAREALEFIQPLATQKNVRLNADIEPIQARVDAVKLGQVLINLLNNAVQHNREGIDVTLAVKLVGNDARITVADNGKGIPASALAHLFDRFYKLEKSRTNIASKSSSGLCLAICKAVVEAHGGSIGVQSIVGRGTEFTIKLPLA